MEDAEVDDVEDAINLDDNGSIVPGTLCNRSDSNGCRRIPRKGGKRAFVLLFS